jgi:hypothetical protein
MSITIEKVKRNKKYMKMAKLYKEFNPFNDICDYSDEALLEAYNLETHGIVSKEKNIFREESHNGYVVGKKYMDVTFAMWKNDVDTYGWGQTIRGLMDKNFDPVPAWVVKIALDEHIKNTWFYNADVVKENGVIEIKNKKPFSVPYYDVHLKFIDHIDSGGTMEEWLNRSDLKEWENKKRRK